MFYSAGMEHSREDWDAVVYSVVIEMDRMFDVLERKYPSSFEDTSLYLHNINLAFRENLKAMDVSAAKEGLTKGNPNLFEPEIA
jgi:hypothetical protein